MPTLKSIPLGHSDYIGYAELGAKCKEGQFRPLATVRGFYTTGGAL